MSMIFERVTFTHGDVVFIKLDHDNFTQESVQDFQKYFRDFFNMHEEKTGIYVSCVIVPDSITLTNMNFIDASKIDGVVDFIKELEAL